MKTILVVEDDRRLARMAQINLEAAGYQVVIFNEGVQARDYLALERPDLALLDMMLPTISGWDLLDFLQHQDRLRTVPVVVISAMASQDDQRRARLAGAREYFVKPFGIRDLLACVEALLQEATNA
jgi:DNA-binding response OmpR family regulator